MELRGQQFEMEPIRSGYQDMGVKISGVPEGVSLTCVQAYKDTLYLGTNDSVVYALNIKHLSEGEIVLQNPRQFYPHCKTIHFILAHPKFLIVVPLKEQQLIRVWNRETLQIRQGYQGHQQQITQVICLEDGQHFVSVSFDGTARVWSLIGETNTGKERVKFDNKYPLLAVEEIDRDTLAFGGDDCIISVWNWRKDPDVIRCKVFAHPASVLYLHSFKDSLYSVGGDTKIKKWQVSRGHCQSLKMDQEIIDGNICLKLMATEEDHEMVFPVFGKSTGRLGKVDLMDCRGHQVEIKGEDTVKGLKKISYNEKITSMSTWREFSFYCISSNQNQLRCVPTGQEPEPAEPKQKGCLPPLRVAPKIKQQSNKECDPLDESCCKLEKNSSNNKESSDHLGLVGSSEAA